MVAGLGFVLGPDGLAASPEGLVVAPDDLVSEVVVLDVGFGDLGVSAWSSMWSSSLRDGVANYTEGIPQLLPTHVSFLRGRAAGSVDGPNVAAWSESGSGSCERMSQPR